MDAPEARQARHTWEAIAASFAATRNRPWRPVVEFLENLGRGTRLLDAGAGNGRHAREAFERGLRPVALDLSRGLLERGLEMTPQLGSVQGLLERLPFKDASFEAALAVATLHHVRGRIHRLEAWRELRRVVRPGTPLLASVWALDQPRFEPLEAFPSPPPRPGMPTERGDVLLRWTQHGLSETRFVHLFRAPELRKELEAAGWQVERVWDPRLGQEETPGNHFALARAAARPHESL